MRITNVELVGGAGTTALLLRIETDVRDAPGYDWIVEWECDASGHCEPLQLASALRRFVDIVQAIDTAD